MFNFIVQDLTFQDYPLPTLIHWAQGLLVGFLVTQAHFSKNWHLIGYALISTICFISYESLEMKRIADKGDIDVLNFTLMIHISALLTFIFHLIKKRTKR